MDVVREVVVTRRGVTSKCGGKLNRSLQKRGVPRRVYYDNGKVYRAAHMRHVVAELGIAPPVHTENYRPEGHGKIEAFNRLLRSSFIAEVPASGIRSLDELNEVYDSASPRELLAGLEMWLESRRHRLNINQLALHALIAAAANGRDDIDGKFMQQQIEDHPLYRGKTRDAPA